MQRYHEDEDGFRKWRRDNPQGFVLNEARGYVHWRLDECGHFKDFIPPRPWTRNPKACFSSNHELRTWLSETGASVVPCASCKPEY